MSKHEKVTKTIFRLKSAQVTVTHGDDNTAKLSSLYAQERGRGHASDLLRIVTDWADDNRISLWLEVQRYGDPHGGLDNSQLIRLYEKFGFDVLEDGQRLVMMGRYPLLKGEQE